jgi:hypothetical protein
MRGWIVAIFSGHCPAAAYGFGAGQRVPPFSGKTMTGERFDANSLKGKPALIQFWTTWCGYCQAGAASARNDPQRVCPGTVDDAGDQRGRDAGAGDRVSAKSPAVAEGGVDRRYRSGASGGSEWVSGLHSSGQRRADGAPAGQAGGFWLCGRCCSKSALGRVSRGLRGAVHRSFAAIFFRCNFFIQASQLCRRRCRGW